MARTTLQTATADNSEITLTETAGDDEAIYISSLSFSYDGTVSGMRLTIEEGDTTIWAIDINDQQFKEFDWAYPLKLATGEDLTVTLTASGTGGTSGTLNIAYYKGE